MFFLRAQTTELIAETSDIAMKKKFVYKVDKCLGCKSCEIACAVAHSTSGDLFNAVNEFGALSSRKKVYAFSGKNYPVSCKQCDDPQCVRVCMSGALAVDPHEKNVVYDEARCVGCWMCVMACPYGAIKPDKKSKKAVRCDLCKDKEEPQCLKACPTKAITRTSF